MIELDTHLIRHMALDEKRIDGRSPDEYREITIEPDFVTSAEGSCRVKIGNTEVLVGVKIDVAEPFADTPNEGVLMVSSEFVPLASSDFESGPPGEESIEVSRVVDRTIRESKAIDFEKLCIVPGEKVWMVCVDIDVLDYDGNLIDASSLAATIALMNARLPDLNDEKKSIYGKKGKNKLPMSGMPLATTFAKISGKIFSDPIKIEERSLDAVLTVGTAVKDGKTMLCAMQKGGTGGFSLEEIEQIFDMAIKKGDVLRKKAEKFV
ncbi:MAG TPA: exosome complex protein Rrp42 [archaeon]|nr:exosome complex protein Rrp42 [archaeon]